MGWPLGVRLSAFGSVSAQDLESFIASYRMEFFLSSDTFC